MTTQPEQILENNLLAQLIALGYQQVAVHDEEQLLANLRTQLEKHNKISLSDPEFAQVLNHLSKGNIYQKAQTLRDRVAYTDANGDTRSLELINKLHWCQNQFQVTTQVKMEGKYKNRYDITLLVNGLPLVQIELKRRGLELKEAFNQINRYERHSFASGSALFQYVQLFVISNGVNTKYFANNSIRQRSFEQTFYWADKSNKLITQLSAFADTFLEPCHVSKMITRYIVLNTTEKALMVLRPYQYYATEAIVDRVKTTSKNGYIWHTTGSGKTLTSYKASQILTRLPEVRKVLFVVDRKDLDYQTIKEFNSFSKGSIDSTSNTKKLVSQLAGDEKLIVTTIQKLNTAISKQRYLGKVEALRNEKVVIIFDECHRSQFGDTHDRIKNFFTNSQLFGFTGTPIFEDNAVGNKLGKRTTKSLFGDCLHKYVITDAIRDENVLKFSIEYISTFRKKDEIVDINVEAIDEAEVMHAPERLELITDYIIAHHHRKTHNGQFTAMFCVPSIEILIRYYRLFHAKKLAGEHNLTVATIFSYQANEEDKEAVGIGFEEDEFSIAADDPEAYGHQHSREHLDEFIGHYNETFRTNYSTKDSKTFYQYYNDISLRVKNKDIDILLVVSMFLTGFDSKPLNTLYVDKNLRYHGLIQAYSRTNRILDKVKSQGNIVSFRNLKAATDEAIALFSNKEAKEDIILEPYETYVKKFNEAFISLLQIAPTVNSVNELPDEEAELAFAKAFRELMRVKNVLSSFTEFTFDDLSMGEQSFEDYKSKYLDLHQKVKKDSAAQKVSILNDIDFELELIRRDEINVTYILKLLAKLKDAPPEEKEKQEEAILDIVSGDVQLRSKRELIEKFIRQHLPLIEDAGDIPDEFEQFWTIERLEAFNTLKSEEKLDGEKLQKIIGDYLFSQKEPLRDEVIDMMTEKPSLIQRKTTAGRIVSKIMEFVEVFINGVGG